MMSVSTTRSLDYITLRVGRLFVALWRWHITVVLSTGAKP